MTPAKHLPPPSLPPRQRLTLDPSEHVSLLLDHISEATGVPRSQVVMGALLDALPALVARADAITKRHGELSARTRTAKR